MLSRRTPTREQPGRSDLFAERLRCGPHRVGEENSKLDVTQAVDEPTIAVVSNHGSL